MLKMMRFTVEFYESETVMTGKTNFDAYLNEQLRDPDFAKRFEQAGEAWEIAVQIAALR
jgi:hypothetical protein